MLEKRKERKQNEWNIKSRFKSTSSTTRNWIFRTLEENSGKTLFDLCNGMQTPEGFIAINV